MTQDTAAPAPEVTAPGTPAAPVAPAPATPDVTAPLPDAAPAAPAAPAPEAAPAAPVTFEPSGDAALDIVLGFIGANGLGPDSPEVQAASRGDFVALEAALKAKGAKGYEQYLALGKSLYEKNAKEAAAKDEADKAAILSAVGGEEAWADIRTWAGANAEEAERSAINAAFQSGGMQAKAMAVYLKGLYEKSSDYTAKGRGARNPNASTSAVPSSGALSPEQYKAAVGELTANLRGRALEDSPEYRVLQSRRMAYRG